jgi:hypothetical protein
MASKVAPIAIAVAGAGGSRNWIPPKLSVEVKGAQEEEEQHGEALRGVSV